MTSSKLIKMQLDPWVQCPVRGALPFPVVWEKEEDLNAHHCDMGQAPGSSGVEDGVLSAAGWQVLDGATRDRVPRDERGWRKGLRRDRRTRVRGSIPRGQPVRLPEGSLLHEEIRRRS